MCRSCITDVSGGLNTPQPFIFCTWTRCSSSYYSPSAVKEEKKEKEGEGEGEGENFNEV